MAFKVEKDSVGADRIPKVVKRRLDDGWTIQGICAPTPTQFIIISSKLDPD